ncbi:MAG: hypothetical protein Q9165_000855 [Trypethelium subeluteriae]
MSQNTVAKEHRGPKLASHYPALAARSQPGIQADQPREDLPSDEVALHRISSSNRNNVDGHHAEVAPDSRQPSIASSIASVEVVGSDDGRAVRRRLRPIHIFMITLNATLGVGLYWRGGLILRTGGPLAVILSFFIVGGLACAVMQCIAEFLCIWPISGALGIYVSEFVDEELGIAVGIMYWWDCSGS